MRRSGRPLVVISIAVLAAAATDSARADHPCDPVTDPGWKLVPSHETVSQEDGPPYQAGATGDWFVDRTTGVLPFCNYYNATGVYSMRSYSLTTETKTERVQICRADGGTSVAVAPHTGTCPPK